MSFELLDLQNPWWTSPSYSQADDHHLRTILGSNHYLSRPKLLQEYREFGPGDIYVVRGARQVGKTTLIKEWICRLLAEGTPGPNILFLSCETLASYEDLQQILVHWIQSRGQEGRLFLFLDEISFVSEWQRTILWCANTGMLAQSTVILTGSNARDLKESAERLPGRRGHGRDIAVFPATPAELRTLPCFAHLSDSQLIDLYLRMGGFPHAIRDVANFGRVSDETYHTYKNWIIGDAARYDLSIESLRHMMYRVFTTCGSRVTLNSIIEQTPLKSHETGLRYLEHLEDSFLCLMHYCYDPDLDGPTFRKSRKVYFVDPLLYFLADAWKLGLTNIWDRSGALMTDRSFVGLILESAVVVLASRGRETYFWYSSKTKKEVDLVIKEAEKITLFDVKLSSESLPPQLGKKVESLDSGWLLQDGARIQKDDPHTK